MSLYQHRRILLSAIASVVCAASVSAQPAMPKPGEVIKYSIVDKASPKFEGKTIIIPTVFLNVGIEGDVWKIEKGGGGAVAKAHAIYFVEGWDKAFLQDLAKKVQDDFASQLRAAGFTVKLYDDVKDDPEMKAQDREQPDEKRGGIASDKNVGVQYALATPTDEQAIKGGLRTFTWALRKLAANQNALVVVPVYPVRAPQMKGEGGGSTSTAHAKIEISPELSVGRMWLYEVNAKEQGGTLFQEGDNRLIAPEVGTASVASSDKYNLSASIAGVKTVYTFNLDREKFSAAVLRATSAFNTQLVEELKKKSK